MKTVTRRRKSPAAGAPVVGPRVYWGLNPTTGPEPQAWCFTCRALVPFTRAGGVTIAGVVYSRGDCPGCGAEVYRVAGGGHE